MGLIKHVNILAASEIRALRYQNKGHAKADQDKILYDEAWTKPAPSTKQISKTLMQMHWGNNIRKF